MSNLLFILGGVFMKEVQVEFTSNVVLRGTLTLPEGTEKYPAVIMLHGSGPVDRNSNVKGLANMNLFNTFAEQFSNIGFASLRYDKRGVKESEGSFLESVMHDLVNDAVAGVQFLKKHPQIDSDKIIVLGHSEGSFLAPLLNHIEPVSGIIFLAGATGSLSEATKYQLDNIAREIQSKKGAVGWLLRKLNVDEKLVKKNKKVMAKIMGSDKDTMRIMLAKINAKWFREHYAYNVSDILPSVLCPSLAITGSKDIQVTPQDAEVIASLVNGPSEYYILDGMNHILRNQTEELTILGLKKLYAKNLDKPLDERLVVLLTDWLKRTYMSYS